MACAHGTGLMVHLPGLYSLPGGQGAKRMFAFEGIRQLLHGDEGLSSHAASSWVAIQCEEGNKLALLGLQRKVI